nr:hypothetical protein [Nanoarchaeum sp.]
KPLVTSILEELDFFESPRREGLNIVYYREGSEFRVRFTTIYTRDHKNQEQKKSHSILEIIADNNGAALTAYTDFLEKMKERGAGVDIETRIDIINSI